MFRAAVFDCDGVLVDTEGIQLKGWNRILSQFDISLSRENYPDYAGKSVRMVAADLIKKHSLSASIDELIAERRDIVTEWLRNNGVDMMPYAEEAVNFFKDHGFSVAVCSGSSGIEVDIKLEKTGLKGLFGDYVITGSDVRRGKPFPDIYALAADRLGLETGQCIAFEDTMYGVCAAKEAGLYCIAVPNEYSAGQDFSEADNIAGSLKEAVLICEKLI